MDNIPWKLDTKFRFEIMEKVLGRTKINFVMSIGFDLDFESSDDKISLLVLPLKLFSRAFFFSEMFVWAFRFFMNFCQFSLELIGPLFSKCELRISHPLGLRPKNT